ncbi:MAG: Dna2/Cas4 domain-containing protein, partial [Planctomycetaceae bacterium]|nr:Dna2/Cas4 domain-containing protein [Planctomycetaceae bacterium]
MHSEDDLLPISALQHLLFCERQTALIHIERLWEENRFTAEGRVLHRKADSAKSETRDGVRITRGLPVHSFKLGLYGVCDVVQFKAPDYQTTQKASLGKRIQAELERSRPVVTDESGVCADLEA